MTVLCHSPHDCPLLYTTCLHSLSSQKGFQGGMSPLKESGWVGGWGLGTGLK